jgi:Ion channel
LEDIARPLVLMMPIAAVFVAGVVVADGRRAQVRRSLAIASVQVGFTVLSLLARDEKTLYTLAVSCALLSTVVLILFATYCVLRYVLNARIITRDQIYAAICMYVMLGFAFGAVFYLINILNPNSFAGQTRPAGDTPDLMYFSFVTLATLGYGDITPRSNISRSLSVLEALAGMVYIAVFMARLVSLRSSDNVD